MNTIYGHRLTLAAFSLGVLMAYGCAVQQPMSGTTALSVGQARQDSAMASSMFAAKKVMPAAQAVAEPEPQPQVAAETAPEPQAQIATETAPESQTQIAAEPAPKQRGPLTPDEETEIDNQVMP
ncbi:MAG: hypothetical protein PHS14_03645 [Elusimicrobia bacterium]|nr:hypothetical protein [Elusimicrobiota bacterium]